MYGIDMCRELAERLKSFTQDCIDSGNEVTADDIEEISANFINRFKEGGVPEIAPGATIDNRISSDGNLEEVYVWVKGYGEKAKGEQLPDDSFSALLTIADDIPLGLHTVHCELVYNDGKSSMMPPVMFTVVAETELTKKALQKYADAYNFANGEMPIDWEDETQCKYYLAYSFKDNKIKCDCKSFVKEADCIYFTSENVAREAVKAVGEERVIEYLKA